MLKPTDLYQGKCIEISDSFDEISKKCKKMFTGVDKRAKPELMEDDDKIDNIESQGNKNNSNNMRESFYEIYEQLNKTLEDFRKNDYEKVKIDEYADKDGNKKAKYVPIKVVPALFNPSYA